MVNWSSFETVHGMPFSTHDQHSTLFGYCHYVNMTVVGGSISVFIVTLMDPGKIIFGHGTLSSTT